MSGRAPSPQRTLRLSSPRRTGAAYACAFWELPSFGRVADGLDVMTVRIEHKRAVVVRVIVRPQSGRAVVAPARRHRRLVERVDLFPVRGAEGDMRRQEVGLAPTDPEIGLRRDAEADRVLELHDHRIAEWRKRGAIERLAPCDIGSVHSGVIDHFMSPGNSRARRRDIPAALSVRATGSRLRPTPRSADRR